MPTLSEMFRTIHRLRRLARDLQTEVDRGPLQLKARQTFATKQAAALQAAKDALKKKQVAVRDLENSLKSTHQQLDRYKKQLDESGDPKAYEALKHEITTTQTKLVGLEEAILTGMTEADEMQAQIPTHEAAAKKAADDAAGFSAELKTRHGRLAEELKTTLEQLKEAEMAIPPDVRSEYNRRVAAMGAECVAAAENGVCGFCRTAMSVQQTVQLQQNVMVCCTSCHRPLYLA